MDALEIFLARRVTNRELQYDIERDIGLQFGFSPVNFESKSGGFPSILAYPSSSVRCCCYLLEPELTHTEQPKKLQTTKFNHDTIITRKKLVEFQYGIPECFDARRGLRDPADA